MTFRNINENNATMAGRFGSNQGRDIHPSRTNSQNHNRTLKNIQIPNLGHITAEKWVDIICISLISIFLISVFLNWNSFLDSFFANVLFPIISTGTALLGIVIGIGAVIGFIYLKLRRPRRWY